jgi:hypothetical protein
MTSKRILKFYTFILLFSLQGSLLSGQTSFTITDIPAAGYPYSISTGDFNNDGKPDLAIGTTNPPSLTIFLGNGDGTFNAGATYDIGIWPVSLVVCVRSSN